MLVTTLTSCTSANGKVDAHAPLTSSSASAATPSAAVTARRADTVREPEPPVRTTLPSGAQVAVHAVSARPDGELDVPDDVRRAGWWQGGSRVGDPFGVMLIAGHVDSRVQGLGPYSELLDTPQGSHVTVVSRRMEQVFEITSRHLIAQGPLRARAALFSARGAPRLVLVTCAPPYDEARGGYQRLAVVSATPVSTPTRRVP